MLSLLLHTYPHIFPHDTNIPGADSEPYVERVHVHQGAGYRLIYSSWCGAKSAKVK